MKWVVNENLIVDFSDKGDRCFLLLFALAIIEYILTYLPLSNVSFLVSLSDLLMQYIPAITYPKSSNAKEYMLITLFLIPLKTTIIHSMIYEPKLLHTYMKLPFKGEKITLRMIVCLLFLIIVFCFSLYTTFGHGIAESGRTRFFREGYSSIDIFLGWTVQKVYSFCLISVFLYINIFVFIVRPKRSDINE